MSEEVEKKTGDRMHKRTLTAAALPEGEGINNAR